MRPIITAGQESVLTRLGELIASSPHNLVSERARSELWSRHILESVAIARRLPDRASRVLDVGSGAGLPGLVVAVMRPNLEVHLLDSTAKKTRFLREAAQQLGISVVVHTGRAEVLATGELAGSFDVVTARAVAPLARLLRLTIPFLKRGGELYAVKGASWPAELAAAEAELHRTGAYVVATPDDTPARPSSVGSRDHIDGATDAASAPRVLVIGRTT